MKKFTVIVGLLAIVFVIGGRLFVPTFGDYSDGYRVGTLQKFSTKGIFFKTNEGELALQGIKTKANGVSSLFEFSVTDPKIKSMLDSCSGKMVKLTYKQKWHVNVKDGETDYFIEKVEIVK